jgi:hypothetical protein
LSLARYWQLPTSPVIYSMKNNENVAFLVRRSALKRLNDLY